MGFQGYDVAAALLKKDTQRKKKRYLLLLYNKRSSDREIATVERAVAAGLKEHMLLRLEDPDEALKLVLIKNIDLIIIDPSFIGDTTLTVEYAQEIKKRKKVPLLFICENEDKLIQEYRRHLHLYEESDDYVIVPLDFADVGRRMTRMVEAQGRAAKRFQVNVEAEISRIDAWEPLMATVTDVSLVGIGISVTSESPITRGTQLQVKIPLSRFNLFHPQYGDFLKMSARVKRVSIDGSMLGCSFEHMTVMQNECLQEILEVVARRKRAFVRANTPKNKEKEGAPKAG